MASEIKAASSGKYFYLKTDFKAEKDLFQWMQSQDSREEGEDFIATFPCFYLGNM